MSILLSPEIAAKAAVIPDFDRGLALFVERQHALEQWRARRMSPEIRSIVREGMASGAALEKNLVIQGPVMPPAQPLAERQGFKKCPQQRTLT